MTSESHTAKSAPTTSGAEGAAFDIKTVQAILSEVKGGLAVEDIFAARKGRGRKLACGGTHAEALEATTGFLKSKRVQHTSINSLRTPPGVFRRAAPRLASAPARKSRNRYESRTQAIGGKKGREVSGDP